MNLCRFLITTAIFVVAAEVRLQMMQRTKCVRKPKYGGRTCVVHAGTRYFVSSADYAFLFGSGMFMSL